MRAVVGLIAVLASCKVSPKFAGLDEESRSFALTDNIPVTTLANGLRVVVVPDTRTNLVSIDMRYEVGAADDPPGRAGMAHYAEHVMWEAGVSSDPDAALFSNATTMHSSTRFTATALDVDLERALEIEARRLELPCGLLRDELLLRERDVVIQEVEQRRSVTPAMDGLSAAVWGSHHPYGRSVGGTEFHDAPPTELCAFVSAHYVPRLATLVVTGNVDASIVETIRARFERIADRAPMRRRVLPWSPHEDGQTIVVEGLGRPTAMLVIPVPPAGSDDDALVDVAARQIGALLDHANLPDSDAFVLGDHRARVIVAYVEADVAAELPAIAIRMRDALQTTSRQDVTQTLRDLRMDFAVAFDQPRERGQRIADLVATLPRVDQFRRLQQLDRVTTETVVTMIRTSGKRSVFVVPGQDRERGRVASLTTQLHRVDIARTRIDPAIAGAPIPLPTTRVSRLVRDYKLANGLRVILAPDSQSIVIDARLAFPRGRDADPRDRPNRAALAAMFLEPPDGWSEGAYEHRLVEWYMSKVGKRPQIDVSDHATTFRTVGFGLFADWHVWNIAWTVVHGRYSPNVDAIAQTATARARHRQKRPANPLIVLDRAVGHSRTGDVLADAAWVSRKELQRYRAHAFRPEGATLVVSGRFDADAMEKEVSQLFSSWRAAPTIERSAAPPRPRVPRFLGIEHARAPATDIIFAYLPPAQDGPRARAIRDVLAAMLDDRLRVVRESMGVSYGVHSVADRSNHGGGPFGVTRDRYLRIAGNVSSTHAAHAMSVIDTEVARLRAAIAMPTPSPEVAAEFARARRLVLGRTLADPAGASQLANELSDLARRNAPLDEPMLLAETIRTLTFADLAAAASTAELAPEHRIVIVRGPRARVGAAFDALAIDPARIEWVAPE
jgi:zinc protease